MTVVKANAYGHGHRHHAVTVRIRLDDGHELRRRGTRGQGGDVRAEGVEVDDGLDLRG
jgi:hypothetical protein